MSFDFENSVGFWICTTSHALRRSLEECLVSEGITVRQWEVLAVLATREECSQADLAENLGIEAQTLAGVLQRMIRDGWLERRSCDEDRRKKLIRVTEKAENVWNRCVRCCHQVRERAIEGLTAEDLTRLKEICDRMRANLAVEESKSSNGCSSNGTRARSVGRGAATGVRR